MNRSHLFKVASLSMVLVALLGACKLDVGSPDEPKKGNGAPSTSKQSGGADAGDTHAHAPGTGAMDGSGGGPADASGPGTGPGAGGAGGAGGAADGGAPGAPTSPKTALWTAPPEGVLVPLNSAGNEKCTFELAYLVENPDVPEPAHYTITLEKKATAPGSCPEAQGYVTLATHSCALPAGVVRRHATDQMIAVAWTDKPKADEDVQAILHLAQIDWAPGADLHDGMMFVKGMAAAIPEQPLVPTSMNLSVGHDVILSGTGTFPGATGEGLAFEATWSDFLSPQAQAPSAADGATQR